jgi:two-component system, LytTR family, response regulator
MIKCFILDDEEHFIELLTDFVQQTPFLQLIGSASNPLLALEQLARQPADLLFLDINMPHIDGIAFMKIIRSTAPTKVILSTAHAQYALEGFENDVIDYLLKPFSYARFAKAAQKALAFISRADFPEDDFIFVRTEQRGHQRKIEFNQVSHIESQKNYALFHCTGEQILATISLKELEDKLPVSRFLRIHQSFIIQLSQVKAVENNIAVLKSGAQVPVGGKFKDEFAARIRLRNAE